MDNKLDSVNLYNPLPTTSPKEIKNSNDQLPMEQNELVKSNLPTKKAGQKKPLIVRQNRACSLRLKKSNPITAENLNGVNPKTMPLESLKKLVETQTQEINKKLAQTSVAVKDKPIKKTNFIEKNKNEIKKMEIILNKFMERSKSAENLTKKAEPEPNRMQPVAQVKKFSQVATTSIKGSQQNFNASSVTKPLNQIKKGGLNFSKDIFRKTYLNNLNEKKVESKVLSNPSKNFKIVEPSRFKTNNQLSSKAILKSKSDTINKKSTQSYSEPKKNNKPKKSILKRSISSVFVNKLGIEEAQKCIHKSNSVSNVSVMKEKIENINLNSKKMSIINEDLCEDKNNSKIKKVTFFSPNRQSLNRRESIYSPMPTVPSSSKLRERLLTWLDKNAKPLNEYKHLRCFGLYSKSPYQVEAESKIKVMDKIQETEKEADKENVVDMNIIQTAIHDDGFVPIYDLTKFDDDSFHTPAANMTPNDINIMKNVARGALNDLLKLIEEGYSREQCEAWLTAIQEKYQFIIDEPSYWECRALLKESDVTEAIECYKNAIIKGGNVEKIDESLDALLGKFSLLSLDTKNKSELCDKKPQNEKKFFNVFKSTLIQFALYSRDGGKRQENTPLKVTPVRRSGRKSRTGYVSTPHVQLFKTMKDISTPEEIKFVSNKALANNY